ncbi:glycosyltransferase [Mycolicibacterium fortuitum]|uniref:Glycosyl transferase, UDP-glucuronosyltransferase n=1 Tax=Mycolicibacterium fortuitum TaxID=1766 RepID=A0A378UBM1_MYCFO|nr:glycosyltransferase [Mycolicibacterium fortuitum]NOQ99429.1 glycosyltransferase [Mycolicibacterium fortuitum]OBG43052.1 glycosyl transferase family 1 [Mycolicibacterium fortuitum]OBG53486.1 glycosyl transferase family 1 [Mycolicibacterium fortuitum]STZ74069.1 glycosyl transferase, UDP-glucuronosyltransferase [Mycolicibacterium fortuitum]
MKLVLASYGTRGDVEPCVAVGCELVRRGHDVRLAVPPDLVAFAEAAGLATIPYGPDTAVWADAHRDFWVRFFANFWKPPELVRLIREMREIGESVVRFWEEITSTLESLADGADLLITFLNFEPPAVNVAEYYGIPMATVHVSPVRPNGRMLAFLPPSLGRSALKVYEWANWRGVKKFDDAQRRQLGLPKARGSSPRRITERGSLEIQAYDEVCFPGLADEWAQWNGQRPFVGALTMELTTDGDDAVAAWVAAGTPPIFFSFGSTPVKSPADTLAMIETACAELGERALVCAGSSGFREVMDSDQVKVVETMNFAAVFPGCRALVHHGGMGTMSAGLRAGVPMLVYWTALDQAIWAGRVEHLKVGFGRRISSASSERLAADLRTILDPKYVARAREVATQMTKPEVSVAKTADHLERFARTGLPE